MSSVYVCLILHNTPIYLLTPLCDAGSIPAQLAGLTKLKKLQMENNKLSGETRRLAPVYAEPGICLLSRLTRSAKRGTDLSPSTQLPLDGACAGRIPAKLGALSELQVLSLEKNWLDGKWRGSLILRRR